MLAFFCAPFLFQPEVPLRQILDDFEQEALQGFVAIVLGDAILEEAIATPRAAAMNSTCAFRRSRGAARGGCRCPVFAGREALEHVAPCQDGV